MRSDFHTLQRPYMRCIFPFRKWDYDNIFLVFTSYYNGISEQVAKNQRISSNLHIISIRKFHLDLQGRTVVARRKTNVSRA